MFAYRLTDNWEPPNPTYECVPLVYGRNANAVGVPISWVKSGQTWEVDCVLSAGVITGVTALDSTLVGTSTVGTLNIVRDGTALGTINYRDTTLAKVRTTDNPRCCFPKFKVDRGRVGALLAVTPQPGDAVFNVTQHTTGPHPLAIAPTDQWYATTSIGLIQTLPDILLDIASSPDGLRYLSPENTFYEWASLREAKDFIATKGFSLAGQYWGRQSFVRFATELAAQSGCILARRESGLALIPERYGIPKMLFTAANTNDATFHRNNWHRHIANRVSSDNGRVRVTQSLPGLVDRRNDPAPVVFPAEWVDDEQSLRELQRLWLDSCRRQDLEVEFLSTNLEAQKLVPGDLIQVIHPNLEQAAGEVSGYTTDGKPSWETQSPLTWIHQKGGTRVVGEPGQGTLPAARTGPDVGVFRIVETRPVDAIRVAIRAVVRPQTLGVLDTI